MSKDIKSQIDEIVEKINSKSNWSLNEKIRYAYIELGKLIYKDDKFFLTINAFDIKGEKMYDSSDVNKDIYYSIPELIEILSKSEFKENVMCKNSAFMLKYIFDNIGVKSAIIESNSIQEINYCDEKIDINHFFIAATGDEDKIYFMTINNDLPFIQLGFMTEHFANKINYIKNGKPVYKGPEINASTLSLDEIKEIDKKIGYIIDDYTNLDGIKKEFIYKTDKNYKLLLAHYTRLYKKLISILNETYNMKNEIILDNYEQLNVDFESKNSDDYEKSLKIIFYETIRYYLETNYKQDEFKEYIKEIYGLILHSKFDETLEKIIEISKDKKDSKGIYSITALTSKLNQTKNLFNSLKNYSEEVNKTKLKNQFYKLIEYFSLYLTKSLGDDYSQKEDGSYSSEYIVNKIDLCFSYIFDLGYRNNFNELSIDEQLFMIKKILNIIFPELKENNESIWDRIKTTRIINKNDKSYSYLIYVDDKYPVVFDLKNNLLYGTLSNSDILTIPELTIKYNIINESITDRAIVEKDLDSDEEQIKLK